MSWFGKKAEQSAVEPNPAARRFTGPDIWTIIASGLQAHGMILRRGSGCFGRDKWGDGKWFLSCEVDDKPEEDSGLVIHVDNVPFDKATWNSLTSDERYAMCRDHVVILKVKDS